MKKYLFITLFSYFAFSATAQSTQNNVKYFLPDGKSITEDKLDSVNKAWGGKGFLMNHDDKHPDELHLSPMTDEFLKQMAEKKANLNKMLNQPAPDFKLTDLTGKTWSLADLKGKTVVLNFWFTTCVPCLEEMPKLNLVKKKYAASNVIFLAFALDDTKTLNSFLKTHTFDYALFAKTQDTGKAYHIGNYPTSMVIDPKGVIRFLQIGGENIEQALPSAIDATL